MEKKKNRYAVGFGTEIPPQKQFVRIYFIQKGMSEQQADYFYLKYESVGWTVKNWKTLASEWIWMMKHN